MKNRSVYKLVSAALFAALACMATMVIQLRLTPNGYVNLGDCVVLLCAWVLSPAYGMAAAGIGSAMADVLSGFAYYAPATFLIKALMALSGGMVFRALSQHRTRRLLPACILSAAVAEAVMAGGYYIFEAFVLGLGPIPALASMPGNALQAACGGVSGTVAYLLLRRNKTLGERLDHLE